MSVTGAVAASISARVWSSIRVTVSVPKSGRLRSGAWNSTPSARKRCPR